MRLYLLSTILLLAACSTDVSPPLVASEVTITAPLPGMTMSAAYMSLTNNSDQNITVSRVASAQYESVQLHESTRQNGVARMRALPRLEIPAGETTTLRRGGKHLMLTNPRGNDDIVSLQFFDGDILLLTVNATVGSDDT